jgi:hypothetical protein
MNNGVPPKMAYSTVVWFTAGFVIITIGLYIAGVWVQAQELKDLRQWTSNFSALGFGYITGGYRQRVEPA